MILLSTCICSIGYKISKNQIVKIQLAWVLVAIAWLGTPLFLAALAMVLKIPITAAFILPIGIFFFLYNLVRGLNDEPLRDIRVKIPGTDARRSLKEYTNKVYTVSRNGQQLTAKELSEFNEKAFLKRALEMAHGNQKTVARILKMSESSVSAKRKRYGL